MTESPLLTPLLHMVLRIEHDIFLVRQRGREVAAAVGLEHQDQIRMATALSEVARDLLRSSAGADVSFFAADTDSGRPSLRVDLAPVAAPGDRVHPQSGAVARLVDMLDVAQVEEATVVRMSRRIPANAEPLTPQRLEELRAQPARARRAAPDELASQNGQLIAALDEVRSQRDELAVLNESSRRPTGA
jgi:hypothetical protein